MKGAPKRGIGKTLRRMRETKGLTLKKVEAQTGIGVSHLSQIENDLRNINVDKLEKLAACYGCEVADFFPHRGRARTDVSQLKPLTPAQQEVMRAISDDLIVYAASPKVANARIGGDDILPSSHERDT